MASGHKPTASEVLDVMDRLQRDPGRRHALDRGDGIFRVCVEEELLSQESIDWLASAMQELFREGLIVYGSAHGGAYEPPVWNDHWIQSSYDWRVTSAGRADAALYRRESGKVSLAESAAPGQEHDLFISHASEDKMTVARPLAEELMRRGWKVWLDELELTVGDSLSTVIDDALARSRIGVVVLSRAFFAKQWPRRELEGLTAREVAAGSKIILPVWHEVDAHYILERSPVLADRLGVSTSLGLTVVADKISLALERAGLRAAAGLAPESVLQSIEPSSRLPIPTTSDEQARIMIERPDFWEYRLFAGVLAQGKRELETKWDDHELRLPSGPRREFDSPDVMPFLSREIGRMRDLVAIIGRLFEQSVQQRAFGPKGEQGDPARIEHLARRILGVYESAVDWAAELRNTSVPGNFKEVREATACMVDAPLNAIREFIDSTADEMERIGETVAKAQAANASEADAVHVTLTLTLEMDPAVEEQHRRALKKLEEEFGVEG